MKKIAIIIPARYASTRFPGKPLAMLGPKPVIQHVCENAAKSGLPVYVATDDNRIRECVESFGGNVIMTASTHRSGTDRLCEALDKLPERPDVVINLQGDEPFVSVEQIQAMCDCFDDEQTQIATLVQRFDQTLGFDALFSPNLVKVVFDDSFRALYFSRSIIPYTRSVDWKQWLETTQYFTHIGMYAYRSEVLRQIAALPQSWLEMAESLEQLRWLQAGYTIRVAISEKSSSIGIDTPEDLAAANEKLNGEGEEKRKRRADE